MSQQPLEDRTITVLRSICFDLYPPTNPAVILAAMREWYLTHGADEVFKRCVSWLAELEKVETYDTETYRKAQEVFQQKTGIVVEQKASA